MALIEASWIPGRGQQPVADAGQGFKWTGGEESKGLAALFFSAIFVDSVHGEPVVEILEIPTA